MQVVTRTIALLVCAFLLTGIVSRETEFQSPRTEHLEITAPPALSALPAGTATAVAAPSSSPVPPDAELTTTSPAAALSRGLQDDVRELRSQRTSRAAPEPVSATPDNLDLYIHLPPDAAQHQPLRVLVALHGMGGRGDKFASGFVDQAERNGWLLVAPTLPYNRDYMDPARLLEEDIQYSQALHNLIETLPGRLGLKLHHHVLVLGFSRGAQLAHRFALLYPDCVETVAAISAGSYTMPVENRTEGSVTQIVAFPFGVGDLRVRIGRPVDWPHLRQVSFWVGVGEKDNRVNDVPRAFDPYCGRTRVERARAFEGALEAIGVDSRLTVFPNVDHEVTPEMRKSAMDFMRKDELADNWND